MKKILLITGGWGNGGIENLISIYCSEISGIDLQMDVFAFSVHESVYTPIVLSAGGHIYGPSHKITGNYITKNIRVIKEFVSIAKQYDIVHYNTAFALAYLHCLILKMLNPRAKIIIHSHGDSLNPPHEKIKRIFHYTTKNILSFVTDYGLACSLNSGKWQFPKRFIQSSRFSVLKNATNLEDFAFTNNAREVYRKKLNSGTKLVVGTIGRIEYQKNPFYILSIIKDLASRTRNFQFLWIGDGADSEIIKQDVLKSGLSENVVFINHTTNVKEYLSAMDVFILPSRYEGLGIVLLEAQANGLSCLASNTTPPEAKITDKISFLPIQETDVPIWGSEILKHQCTSNRDYPKIGIEQSGYEVNNVCMKLKKIYLEL